MSIPALVQVYDETRRLAIAGSAVAPGDFRLKKLVPVFEKAGEKAPVFGKVAQGLQGLVDSTEKTASAALLDLATLVNAILYTQGETGIAGELKPLETTDLGGRATQTSARILKPLLEALSSTGSGRLELIRDAYERGTFNDLRLIKPALGALDDPYPEIGDFMAEKVLPLFGKAILPELRARLDVKGRGGHLHRLKLLHRLDPQGSRDLIERALSDGSKEMKVAAVECLGTADDDLAYLLEQTKAKSKEVRAAALRALSTAGVSTPEAVAALKKAIDGADLELIITRVQQTSLAEIRQYVIEQAQTQLGELLKLKDAALQGAAVARLQQLVLCLEGRTDAPAEAFLLGCFDKASTLASIKSAPAGSDLNELVAHVLARGAPAMQKKLAAAHQTLRGPMLSSAIFAARAIMTPSEFYDEFSPSLAAKGKKDRSTALTEVLTSETDRVFLWHRSGVAYHDRGRRTTPLRELDPRWVDTAVEAQSLDLVCRLARPGNDKANRFLFERLAKMKEPHEVQRVLHTMVRIGHPGAVDAVIDALRKQAKERTHYYLGYWYGRLIAELPRSAYTRFEELIPTLPEKMADQLMESILALKNKPE